MSPPPHPLIVFGTASFGTGVSQAKFYDAATATPILSTLRSRGVHELDTARAYPVGCPGESEALLGSLSASSWATISTKVVSWSPRSHTSDGIHDSVAASLAALRVEKVDIMYLHAPDRSTPFEETCRAMDEEYRKGRYQRFGLSNYTADEVERIVQICAKKGFVKPSVYQGRYNAIIRGGEDVLFPVLRKHGISFYAYSPTAVGLFSGKVNPDSVNIAGSRWDSRTRLGVVYSQDYLKPALLAAAAKVSDAAAAGGLDGHAVALRWTVYHSILSAEYGDAVVLGASSLKQLEANLDAVEAGPLGKSMVDLVDWVWKAVEGDVAKYHV
ncbi:hypothetical protein MMC13_005066 [Lambiella insularis]|nr:hypothetical protein [Lambiella insularis]